MCVVLSYCYIVCSYVVLIATVDCMCIIFVLVYVYDWQGRTAVADCQANNQSINQSINQDCIDDPLA